MILGAIVLFSTIEVVSKYLQAGEGAAARVGSIQVAALRFMLGAVFLLPLLLARRQGKFLIEGVRKGALAMLLLGTFGVFLCFYLLHSGIESTSASTAAVIFSMNPVFTVLIASLALRERLGGYGWLGVGLGLAGAFIAVTGFNFPGLLSRDDFMGSILILVAAVAWSGYTVYGKKYSQQYGTLVVSFLSMAVGSVLFAMTLTIKSGWREMAGYNLATWAWLLYLGIITVGIGYILYFEGLRRVPASRGASLFYLKPVLALLIAHAALGEPISFKLLLASVMVACGILLVTLSRETGKSEAESQVEKGPGLQKAD